jgi:secreted PhoX family phosphatase
MADGLLVPDRADVIGCFYLDDDRVTLIRNHELLPKHQQISKTNEEINNLAYDSINNTHPLPGSTTSIIYNDKRQQVEHQFMSLIGTIRNCSGVLPHGTLG